MSKGTSLLDMLNALASRNMISKEEFGRIMHDPNATEEEKQEAERIAAEVEAERERAAFESARAKGARGELGEISYFEGEPALPATVADAEEVEDGRVRVPKNRRRPGAKGRKEGELGAEDVAGPDLP